MSDLIRREPCVDCGFPIAIDRDALRAGDVTCPVCGLWLTVERTDAAIDGPMRGASALALRPPTATTTPWLRVAADGRSVVVGHEGYRRWAHRLSLAGTGAGALAALFFNGAHRIELACDRPPTAAERELLARVLRRMVLLAAR